MAKRIKGCEVRGNIAHRQSAFLAVASLVVLSIFLRQRNSPESKQAEAAHSDTGT